MLRIDLSYNCLDVTPRSEPRAVITVLADHADVRYLPQNDPGRLAITGLRAFNRLEFPQTPPGSTSTAVFSLGNTAAETVLWITRWAIFGADAGDFSITPSYSPPPEF